MTMIPKLLKDLVLISSYTYDLKGCESALKRIELELKDHVDSIEWLPLSLIHI